MSRVDRAVGAFVGALESVYRAGAGKSTDPEPDTEALFVEAVAEKARRKSWVPYEGPQGGQGWENIETGDIVYDDEPPGQRMTPEDVADAALEAGVDPDELDDLVDAVRSGETPAGGYGDGLDDIREPDLADEEKARRALEALDHAEDNMTDRASDMMRNRTQELASRARHDETVERLASHPDGFLPAEERSGELSEGRAAFRTKASGSFRPEGIKMWLAEDTSESTVFHEWGHGLADAFAYDYQHAGSVAHKYPDEGLPDWDFGEDGEHGRKRNYMLTAYEPWDERGDHSWEDFNDRGEPVESVSEVEVGDRLAFRGVDRTITEGTVSPMTRPVSDVEEQLEPGDRVTGTAENAGVHFGRLRDREDAEVVATIPRGSYIVIGEEETWPLQEGADPDEVRRQPNVSDVIQVSEANALVEDGEGEPWIMRAQDITGTSAVSGLALRTPDGDDVPLRNVFGDGLPARRMASAEERDWVGVRERLGSDTWRGETVRFRFGAQDEATEGVVVEETNAQVTIAYTEGGEVVEKQVNKSQAYNQQLWFAQDETEYDVDYLSADREPPGLREAKYENMDVTEQEVDWDTSIQYDDAAEQAAAVERGDMVLLRGPDGDRHPLKVDDMIDSFESDSAVDLQGDLSVEEGGGSTLDLAEQYGTSRVTIGVEDGDYSVMGISKQREWVGPDYGRGAEAVESFGAEPPDSPDDLADYALHPDDDYGDEFVASVEVRMPDGTTERMAVNEPFGDGEWMLMNGSERFVVTEDGALDRAGPEPRDTVGGLDDVVGGYEGVRLSGGRPAESFDQIEKNARVQYEAEDGSSAVSTVESVDPENETFVTEDGQAHTMRFVGSVAPPKDAGEGAPDSAEEAVGNLVAEVNKAWHDMVTTHEKRGKADSRKHIGSGYSETNAHETLAKLNETMMGTATGYHAKSVADSHPGLLEAYVDVFEPSPHVQDELNEWHEENDWKSPFETKPFPSRDEPDAMREAVEDNLGSTFIVPPGNEGANEYGIPQSVSGDEVEVRLTERGETVWMPLEEVAEEVR